jgi:hypothetical protein
VFHLDMAAQDHEPVRRRAHDGRRAPLSAAVDVIRDGETVLSLIDPAARGRDPVAFSAWLQARLVIGELPRLMHPGCDRRCEGVEHSPERMVVLADLALDPTGPRPRTWWTAWNDTLERRHQAGTLWFAGAPAMPLTPPSHRLVAGTRVRRIATTDPHLVAYDGVGQETLFSIEDGDHAGSSLVTVSFGHAPLLPALAGVLVAPDHPPVLDPPVAVRLLAAGWAAVERGLPHED